MADAAKGQPERQGTSIASNARLASPDSRLTGHYRLDLSDGDETAVVHVEGPMRVRLTSAESNHGPGSNGDPIELRFDTTTMGSVTISLDAVGEHWHLNLQPSRIETSAGDLVFRATHDELTGLANREQFLHHAEMALGRTMRSGTTLGVLYLDLDGFKTVNDIYGHRAGDLVLAEVGQRLRAASRPMDLAARLGGDEFALACENLQSPIEAGVIARRVIDALEPPMNIDGRRLAVSASVGIALSDGTATAADIVRNADSAMYKAKSDPTTSVRMHSDADQLRIDARQGRDASLRAALAESRLDVAYRPIHAIDGSGIVAIETNCGLVASDAESGREEFSVSHEIEDDLALQLLRQTAADLVEIRGAGLDEQVPIHVRLPSRLLLDAGLADLIVDLMSASDLGRGGIALDVDESLNDMRVAGPGLTRLRDAGIPLSIVGFGLGRSSLGALASTPAQVLKIDRALVANTDTTRGAGVLAAIIDLAHAHSMTAMALGVDTTRRLDILRGLGCDAVGGSVFSDAKSKDELLFAIGAGLQVA